MYHNQRLSQLVEIALVLSLVSVNHRNAACQAAERPPVGETESASWTPSEDSWNYWWSYSGVSGPAYWGLLNLDWFMCDKGRRQSPINIETNLLVYDPHLSPLRADNNLISGILSNDGHAIVFNASMSHQIASMDDDKVELISGQLQKANHVNQANNGLTIVRRNAEKIDSVLVQLEEMSNLPSDFLPQMSSALVRDLSNNVELSISQNNRLDSEAGALLDKSAPEAGEPGSNLLPTDVSGATPEVAGDDENQNGDSDSFRVQFTGAGLIYPFKFEALYLRFGLADQKFSGSEHHINSHSYPAELQLIAYNLFLYKNYAEASQRPHGLLGISVLIDVALEKQTDSSNGSSSGSKQAIPNGALESLCAKLGSIRYRGSSTIVKGLNLTALLSDTDNFVTYEGSLTTPGCHETVNWIVLNKPLYISQSNLDNLRSISADEQSSIPTGTLIAGNTRPVQPVNNRPVRTNIKPPNKGENPETCQRLWKKFEYRHVV